MKVLMIIIGVFFFGVVAADNIKKIQYENCIAQHSNRCLSNRCALSSDISEDPNCSYICKREAKELCEKGASDLPTNSNVIHVN